MRTAWAVLIVSVLVSPVVVGPADAARKYVVVEQSTLFLSCGIGAPPFVGDGTMVCGSLDPNHRSATRWDAAEDLTTMVVEARWHPSVIPCAACLDGQPWLMFRLSAPAGTLYAVWSGSPPTTAARYDFNQTEEVQRFVTGTWTLHVEPSSGIASVLNRQNGGLVLQTVIEVYVTMAHGGYELPPDYTAIPPE